MKKFHKFNFSDMICDLQKCGYSITDIAIEVGTSQPMISQLKLTPGKEPKYSLGYRIRKLHKREMRKVRYHEEQSATPVLGNG